MNLEQLKQMAEGQGFIAALDQSGGSTPTALLRYGLDDSNYSNDDEMFALVHEMRTRIIKSPAFSNERIIGAILFENTMNRKIDNKYTADFLWEEKGVVPFLKIDKGLAALEDGVQLMKPIPGLDETLAFARDERNIFGTKMRSVIKEYNEGGIQKIVDQQFEIGMQIANAGLVPIIEPEVDINCPDKAKVEALLKDLIMAKLAEQPEDTKLIFKLTIPTNAGQYADIIADPRTVRLVALSGGYTREDSNRMLAENKGMIASFSRALVEGLTAQQTDEEFDALLMESAESIKAASIA